MTDSWTGIVVGSFGLVVGALLVVGEPEAAPTLQGTLPSGQHAGHAHRFEDHQRAPAVVSFHPSIVS